MNPGYDAPIEDEPRGIRTAVMASDDLIRLGRAMDSQLKKLDDILTLWKCFFRSTKMRTLWWPRKKRTRMDVDALVTQWHQALKVLSTAHDKHAIDKTEYSLDELNRPLLSAPVRQLREFFKKLTVALKADPEIPFFVWSMFFAWEKVMVDKAQDQEVLVLRDRLAEEIAAMVEKNIVPDIFEALVGALRWRSPEALTHIKTELEKGEKPRLRGRQSCLFLTVGEAEVML